MSNKEPRPVGDHHIANLDRHAGKLFEQLQANEWKVLSTPEMEVYQMKEILAEQAELEKVLNWLANIKNRLRPPAIINPNQNGMKIVGN